MLIQLNVKIGFAAKVKEGKASGSSGFGGKGLERLDQDRDALSRAERAAYGEAGGVEGEKKETDTAVEGGAPIVATNANTASLVESLEVEIKRGPAPADAKKSFSVAASAAELALPALAAQGYVVVAKSLFHFSISVLSPLTLILKILVTRLD